MLTGIEEQSIPQQRLDEIEFYNYIKRLLEVYNHNVVIFDLVDVFATFGEIVPATIKKLVQQIYIGDASIVPSREEQLIIYRKKGFSMRQIRDITGIHPNTQYRLLNSMKENRNLRPSISPRLDEDTYHSMKAFMNEINKFKEV
jgi:hypothetical protein